jgi:LmbE family N-acetylglucosaminyl deacetylase
MAYNKSILCIQAHPDDMESWCAGTLALMKNKGYSLTIVAMTGGNMGGIGMTEEETVSCRLEEAAQSAKVLDAPFHCLGGRDGFLYDTQEMRIKTIDLIRRVNPGIVLSHSPFDYHSDHRTTGNMVEMCCQLTTLPNVPCSAKPMERTPLFYRTAPMTFTDVLGNPIPNPHFFVDISSVMEKKMEMLSHHQSQIELMKVMHGMDNFFDYCKEYNRDVGNRVNVPFAEYYWQHLGGGFQKEPLIQNELKEFIKKK